MQYNSKISQDDLEQPVHALSIAHTEIGVRCSFCTLLTSGLVRPSGSIAPIWDPLLLYPPN